jgi:hypothetical protein
MWPTPSRSSRDPRRRRDMQEGRVPADHPLTPMTAWQPVCHFVDGTEHERLRGALTESLERFDRRGLRVTLSERGVKLIDEAVVAGPEVQREALEAALGKEQAEQLNTLLRPLPAASEQR